MNATYTRLTLAQTLALICERHGLNADDFGGAFDRLSMAHEAQPLRGLGQSNRQLREGFIGKGLSMNAGAIRFRGGEYRVVDRPQSLEPFPPVNSPVLMLNYRPVVVDAAIELHENGIDGHEWRNVSFLAAEIEQAFPAGLAPQTRPLTTAKGKTEFATWLKTEIEKHPNAKPQTKQHYQKQAKDNFGVGTKSFLAVWAATVAIAPAWSNAGAPRGPRQNRNPKIVTPK